MHSSLLLCVFFALSVSSLLPGDLLTNELSPFKHLTKKEKAVTKSYNPFTKEDIKFCGTYEGECSEQPTESLKYYMRFIGGMHNDPIVLSMPATLYKEHQCQEGKQLYTTTMEANIEVMNSISKYMELTITANYIEFHSVEGTAGLTCTEPLELNKVYDINFLNCTDENGKDAFIDYREMIGLSYPEMYTFSENMVYLHPGRLPRISDDGCTSAASFMEKASSIMKQMTSAKREKNEDIKYCGGYSTGCMSSPLISTKSDATVMGMMHKNPIYLQYPVEMYVGTQCLDEVKVMVITLSGPLDVKNDVKKTVDFTYEKGTVKFTNEMMISQYTCSEPLELNKEYDITKLDCKDSTGQDPFADVKEQIGKTNDIGMTFGENSMSIEMDGSDPIAFERVDDTGCHCAKNLRGCFVCLHMKLLQI